MDRYAMAREFEKVKLKDQIQRIDDIDGLRQLAVDLTELNYRLKEVIASQVLERIPQTRHLPPA